MEKINWKLFLIVGFFLSFTGVVTFILGDFELNGVLFHGKRIGFATIPLFPLGLGLRTLEVRKR